MVWNISNCIWPKRRLYSKLDRCNDRKICGKLSVNKTVETPVTSTCLSADCIELKFDRMSSKLMHTEINTRCSIAIRKESWRWINWNRPVCHKVESSICCWYPNCTCIALKRTSLLQAYLIFFFLILYEVWKWNHRWPWYIYHLNAVCISKSPSECSVMHRKELNYYPQ